jgi:hypothetical protein
MLAHRNEEINIKTLFTVFRKEWQFILPLKILRRKRTLRCCRIKISILKFNSCNIKSYFAQLAENSRFVLYPRGSFLSSQSPHYSPRSYKIFFKILGREVKLHIHKICQVNIVIITQLCSFLHLFGYLLNSPKGKLKSKHKQKKETKQTKGKKGNIYNLCSNINHANHYDMRKTIYIYIYAFLLNKWIFSLVRSTFIKMIKRKSFDSKYINVPTNNISVCNGSNRRITFT